MNNRDMYFLNSCTFAKATSRKRICEFLVLSVLEGAPVFLWSESKWSESKMCFCFFFHLVIGDRDRFTKIGFDNEHKNRDRFTKIGVRFTKIGFDNEHENRV